MLVAKQKGAAETSNLRNKPPGPMSVELALIHCPASNQLTCYSHGKGTDDL